MNLQLMSQKTKIIQKWKFRKLSNKIKNNTPSHRYCQIYIANFA